jgi:antitoxin (DNA-binding transcriptional repressor) of toxin-antitoxin stability system
LKDRDGIHLVARLLFGGMKSISVAELRQVLSTILDEVENGRSYLVISSGRAVAQLLPLGAETASTTPPRKSGRINLSARPRRHSYEETEALLREMASDR